MQLFPPLRRKRTDAEVAPQQSSYGITILLALNGSGRHIYEGTVPAAEKARRRAKDKRARAARRIARKAA